MFLFATCLHFTHFRNKCEEVLLHFYIISFNIFPEWHFKYYWIKLINTLTQRHLGCGRSMPNPQGSPIIHILSRISPIPHIDTYLFKTPCNIFLPYSPRLHRSLFPVRQPVTIQKTLLPSLIMVACPAHHFYLELIITI